MKAALKRVGRVLLWPLRRFFDPRFQGIAAALNQVVTSNAESTVVLGRSIADVQATTEEIQAAAADLQAVVAETRAYAERASGVYFERLASGSPDDLDASVAQLLNYAEGHRGFAAQRQLWFNPPLSLAYEPRGVRLVEVNERLAEVPFVFRELSRIRPGARVLDVGATESTVAVSLASLGYEVTALDIRPYPLSHPRLRTVVGAIEDWEGGEPFDAVLCLSTIEHIGLAAYGGDRKEGADAAAMLRIHELTVPNGLMVLTTRFGTAGSDDFQRTYDRAGLDRLLAGWTIDHLSVVRREDATTWTVADEPIEGNSEAVALVTATRSA